VYSLYANRKASQDIGMQVWGMMIDKNQNVVPGNNVGAVRRQGNGNIPSAPDTQAKATGLGEK
jgi:hypothetical protein